MKKKSDLKGRLAKCVEGQKVRRERKNEKGRDWQRLRVSDFNQRNSRAFLLVIPTTKMCTSRSFFLKHEQVYCKQKIMF